MNQIFKVIWNQATQTWVAVSELSKSKGKSASQTDSRQSPVEALKTGKLSSTFRLSLLTLALMAGSSMAFAENYVTVAGTNVAVGKSSSAASGTENATAVGASASAKHSGSVALGAAANASGPESVSIGYQSSASGAGAGGNQFATAVGSHAVANRPASSTYGAYAKADGNFSTAIGHESNATGQGTTAIGQGAIATSTDPHTYGYSTALGQNAKATGVSSNALGRLSNATGYYATSVGANSLASGSSAIAIGGANGDNGAKATADNTIAVGQRSNATNGNAIAVGKDSLSTGLSSISIGSESKATDFTSVALGWTANASANSSVAVGPAASASQVNSVAVGLNAQSSNKNSVALGANSVDGVAVAVNNATVNHMNYSGFAGQGSAEKGVVSVGSAGQERQITNVAAGRITASSTDAINGSQLYAVADKLGAGWNIKGQGTAKGVVRPSDTVDFVNGTASTAVVSGSNGNYSVKYDVNAGKGLRVENNQLVANVADIAAGNNVQVNKAANGTVTISATDTNTHASVSSNDKSVTIVTSKNSENATNYDLKVNVDNSTIVNEGGVLKAVVKSGSTNITAGDNVRVTGNASSGYTIAANGTTVSQGNGTKVTATTTGNTTNYRIDANVADVAAGNNVTVTKDANGTVTIAANNTQATVEKVSGSPITVASTEKNANGTVKYQVGVNVGDGLKVQDGKLVANGTNITAGNNVSVSGNATNGYTISANNTQASVAAASNSPVTVTTSANNNGTTQYNVGVNVGDGLKVEGGKLVANGTNVTAGKNVNITGNASSGYTINANDTVVAAGDNIKSVNKTVASNGTTTYTVNAADYNAGKGVTITGNKTNGYTINANVADIAQGDNITVNKDANGTVTISGKNTQASVQAADNTVSVTSSETNANGTTIYKVKSNFTAGSGVTINGNVISANGTNITAGDNVNVSKTADGGYSIAANGTVVEAGKGTTVTSNKAGNNTTYIVNANVADIKGGNNVNVSKDGNGNYTIDVNTSVPTTNLTRNDNGTIKVPAGEDAGKFANASEVANAINNASFNATIGTDTADFENQKGKADKAIKAGDTITLNSGKNLKVKQDGANFTYATEENVSFTTVNATTVNGGTIVVGNATHNTSLTSGANGLDVGGDKITNVANGTLSNTSTDAVNGSQLYATNQNVTNINTTVAKGLNFQGNEGEVINKQLGETLTIKGGNAGTAVSDKNTYVSRDAAGNLIVKMAETPEFKGLTLNDGSNNVVNFTTNNQGLNIAKADGSNAKISGVAAAELNATSTEAVNGSQLYATNNNVTNVSNEVAKGWNVTTAKVEGSTGSVTGTNLSKVAMGDTVTVKAGNNINITQNGKDIAIATSMTPSFTNVTTGDTVLSDNGLTIVGGPNVTKSGIDAGNKTITNVAPGVNGTDAVNLDQLNKTVTGSVANTSLTVTQGKVDAPSTENAGKLVNATVVANAINESGWHITAANNGGELDGNATDELINPGETVKLQAGQNIKVKQEGNNFTYSTADNVTFTTVNTTKLIVGEPGQPGKNGVAIDGTNGTIGLNGKDGASANVKVEKGTTTVNASDKGQEIDRVKYVDSNNKTREVATLDDGLKFVGDDGTTINRTLGSTLNISGGANTSTLTDNNIGVVGNANGTLTVKLNKDINLTDNGSLNVGGVTINNGGINAGDKKITNVTDGELGPNSKDAVNGSQLYATNQNITNINTNVSKGLNFVGNTGEVINKQLGETLKIIGALSDTAAASAKNIRVDNVDGNLTLKMADTPEFTGVNLTNNGNNVSFSTNEKGLNISKDGENATISGVKAAELNATSTEAVNGSQLYATNNEIAKGWNVTTAKVEGSNGVVTNNKLAKVAMGDTVTVKAGNNININQDGQNIEIATSSTPTFNNVTVGKDGQAGTIGINGKDGASANITVEKGHTTVNPADKGQDIDRVKYVDSNNTTREVATLDDGLKFVGDDGTTINRTLGTTLNISGGANTSNLTDNNIGVVGDANGTLTVKLNKDINLGNNGSLSVGGVTINNNGIDAGNKTIANVSAGVNGTDAVNLDQLNSTVAKAVENTTLNVTDGVVDTPTAENAGKLVNATVVASAINASGWSVTTAANGGVANNITKELINPGETVKLQAGKNIVTTQEGNNITFATAEDLNVTTIIAGEKGENGKDGTIGVNGKDGSSVVLNGKDGSIGLTGAKGKDGKDGASTNISVQKGTTTVNETRDGGQEITRVVYADKDKNGNDITREIATMDDGLKFQGNQGETISKKLGETLNIVGELANNANASAKNIRVDNDNGNLTVKIADNPEFTGITLKEGDNSVNLTTNEKGLNVAKADGSNATISGVKDAVLNATSTEAVNGSQLYATNNNVTNLTYEVAKGWNITTAKVEGTNGVATNSNPTKVAMGDTVTVKAGNNIQINQNGQNIEISTSATPTFTNVTTNEVIVGKDGKDGVDGKVGVSGKDGASVVLNGKDGSIGLTGARGADGKDGASTNLTVTNGTTTVAERDGGNNVTRVTYTDKDKDGNNITREIATLDDGLKFKGDNETVINRTLGSQLNIVGGAKEANLTDNNIGVVGDANGTLTVKLNKDINLGDNGSINVGGVTINNNGIDAGNKAITNVKAGTNGTDAVNVDQLNTTVAKAVENTTLTVDENGKVQDVPDANKGKLVNATVVAEAINASGWTVTTAANGGIAEGASKELVNPGETVKLQAGKNVKVVQEGANFTFSTSDNLVVGEKGADGKDGVDGSIGVNGKDGSSVVINGKDGSIGLTGPRGADGKDGASANIKVVDGVKGLDGNDGKDGESKTRIVYEKPNGETETVATMNDGLKFKGNKGETINKKLGETLEVVGELADNAEASAKNVRVDNENGKLTVKLANQVDLGANGSITMGNVSVHHDGINAGNTTISNVKDGDISPTSKDAVNGSQLYATNQNVTNLSNTVAKGWNVQTQVVAGSTGIVKGSDKANVAMGDTVNVQAGNNIEITQNGKDIAIATSATPTFVNVTTNEVTVGQAGKDGKDGVDGKIGVNGKDGSSVVINGKDGSIGLTGAKGADGKDGASANIKVENGAKGLDGNDGKDGESKTRIVYEKPNGEKETVATMNDGLTFAGDTGTESKRKLGEKVTVRGGQTDEKKLSNKPNIGVVSDGNGNLDVKLAKDLDLDVDGSVKVGDTIVNNNGLTIDGGPSITKDGGINAGGNVISNVAPGVKDTDAVNVAQLKHQANRIGDLDNKVNKNKKRADAGTASVAAMANIPQASLPGKSGVGFGIGHRGKQTAVAIGYSRVSDNAKHIIKFSAGMDSQRTGTVGAGYMYQW